MQREEIIGKVIWKALSWPKSSFGYSVDLLKKPNELNGQLNKWANNSS